MSKDHDEDSDAASPDAVIEDHTAFDPREPSRRGFLSMSGTLAAGSALTAGAAATEEVEAKEVPEEPDEGGRVRHFDVHAIDVDIVYNRYGLHQPVGVMYALEEDRKKIKELSGKRPCRNTVVFEDDDEDDEFFCEDIPEDERTDGDTRVIQPLTLRAEQGDIIEIEFHNDLDRAASMHMTSLPYEVDDSDGMHVGENPDTTVDPGESITYRWYASTLGGHFFLDGANQAYDSAEDPPQEANLLSRGLFGSVIVHPQGSEWTDPFTGEEVQGRVQADIHLPDDLSDEAFRAGNVPGLSYRQFVIYYHTPEGMRTADGDKLTFPDSDEDQTTHAINYRADPTGNRVPDGSDPEIAESFYNSWLNGDPGGGDNVYPMYVGDPVNVLPMGASVEENHVHHLHGHRWKETPPDVSSGTVDSQTVGLGAVYESPLVIASSISTEGINDFTTVRPDLEFEDSFAVGAGGAHRSTGDVLFHCHLFPHYGEGMWGIMRVLDKERKGLQPLPTNEPPIPIDSDVPGFPEFIPGEFGETAPFPPYGAAGKEGFRDPTDDEQAALGDDILPGAPYTDPCDPDVEAEIEGEKREYTIVALPADVVYNDVGHHDPNGIVFVLEENAELVKEGKLNPEPLVIRANVGDCVDITLKNEVTEENIAALPGDRFPEGDDDGKPESVPIEAGGKSNHIHFVSYDLLGSDSLATGFNYRQDAQPGEEAFYRWFADEEGTIFFHDHITGIEDVMHGSFASLVVEPPESRWLDPYSGDEIDSGTQAIIEVPDGEDYREFCLAYQDFTQLVDRDGELVNRNESEHNENSGVMAINYRNTPYYIRDDADPAYVHSSFVHGDPSTPTFEAYEDDPVRFRLWHATYEEQHNFTINGRRFDPEGQDPEDAVTQIIGTSEAFTLDLLEEPDSIGKGTFIEELDENPVGLPIKDYLYGSMVVDDLWNGMWGLFREFGGRVDHLEPLPDRKAPKERITRKELEKMGHPAPFSEFEWSERGQLARLLYKKGDDREFPPDKDARQNDAITGDPPELAPSPGRPCPKDVDRLELDVTAFDTEIEYNDYGDIDPYGIAYAMDDDVEAIRDGDAPLEPLLLRATQNDCIDLTLTNDIDFDDLDNDHPHPEMQGPDEDWDRSKRISLHPKQVRYNVLGSDGTTVGFNWDQTIGPGEEITYRWYVNEVSVSSVLHDFADIRSNRHHGAYGRLVVEEAGVEFLDPLTCEPAPKGRAHSVMKKRPKGDDIRDFSLAFADGQYIINEDDPANCVVPPGPDIEDTDDPCNQLGDPEDHGYPAINYSSEPFIRRFEREDDDPANVYDSDIHGDPNTPVLRALLGDPVTFRIHLCADKADGLAFHLADHQWDRLRGDDDSKLVGVDDQISVTKTDRVEPGDGAGGIAESTGDFIYQETRQRRKLEGGSWGIFRVEDDRKKFPSEIHPLPDRSKTVPIEHRPNWITMAGDLTDGKKTDLVVIVPDSARTTCDASGFYLFEGLDSREDVTDLAEADHSALMEYDDDKLIVNMDSNAVSTAKRLRKLFRNAELSVVGTPEECTVDFDELAQLTELKLTSNGDEKSGKIRISVDSVDVDDDSLKLTWEDGSTLTVTEYDTLFEE
ncbi:MAG: multicopper oxidase domain-containing protein [Euryarchaeota archaeon]|nr:multicopper oxidase domain-containing protein [Euryarchaeota archaeon]